MEMEFNKADFTFLLNFTQSIKNRFHFDGATNISQIDFPSCAVSVYNLFMEPVIEIWN